MRQLMVIPETMAPGYEIFLEKGGVAAVVRDEGFVRIERYRNMSGLLQAMGEDIKGAL